MKLLKEDFGESEELNTFVSQIERRFGTYYQVTLKVLSSSDSPKSSFKVLLKSMDCWNKQ